jgi:glycosyltransferase involved in cell wall biosynthesis
MNKLISIIIPCYNQANYLPFSLASVLGQTYSNWECIIVNDGATDNTQQVVKQWCAKDYRFIYVEKQNGGLSSARNAGIDIAKGDYIQFLDADDIIAPTKLSDSLNLVQDNQAIVVSNFASFEDVSGEKLLPPYCQLSQELLDFKSILNQWDVSFTIPIHCGFFPKSLFETIRFNETLKAKEDWVFWIQIAQKNTPFVYLDATLALYRKHAMSMTKDKTLMFTNRMVFFDAIENFITKEEYKQFLLYRLQDNFEYIHQLKKEKSNLKQSNTYQFGLLCKKVMKKLGLLPLAKKIFVYLAPLKR